MRGRLARWGWLLLLGVMVVLTPLACLMGLAGGLTNLDPSVVKDIIKVFLAVLMAALYFGAVFLIWAVVWIRIFPD